MSLPHQAQGVLGAAVVGPRVALRAYEGNQIFETFRSTHPGPFTDGPGDALHHNALTMWIAAHHGADDAFNFMLVHETFGEYGMDHPSSQMDLHNNLDGAERGVRYRHMTGDPQMRDMLVGAITQAAQNSLDAGSLVVLHPETGRLTRSRGWRNVSDEIWNDPPRLRRTDRA